MSRSLRGSRRWRAIWIVVAAALLVAAPMAFGAIGQPFYLRVLTRILIFALAASSLNLMLGFGGMVSLGHAAFVGVGSYVIGILAWHQVNDVPLLTWPVVIEGSVDPLIVWPLAIGAAGVLAAMVGAVSLRTSGLYFIMITLAFAQMVYFFAVSLEQYGGDDGMRLRAPSRLGWLDLRDRTSFYYLVLALFVLALLFLWRLMSSRFGQVISGARQNAARIRALGIDPFFYQLACFVLSGAIAGLAGVLMANLDMFISPSDLSITRSNELVAMVLLGGVGSLWGAPLGAAFYIIGQLALGTLTTHWQLVFGPALICVVLFAPRGLTSVLIPHFRSGEK